MLAQGARTEFVELDVVALDGQEMPVADLTQADFLVKEDGKSVSLQSFTVIAARGRVDEERSVVLLMDDIGVSRSGTSPIRQIGHFLLSPAQLADDVGVVRLSRSHDEAFGDADNDTKNEPARTEDL